MTPANLPDLYARVCAKRPELAVIYKDEDSDTYRLTHTDTKWKWIGVGPRAQPAYGGPPTAFVHAMILAKWVEALPVRHGLDHHPACNRESEDWQVRWYTTDNRTGCGPCEVTPLEALAEFYPGEQA